ncbi:unnamed protein product [Paramecium sonneborni]|uniref:MORN repeat protein n=1 Tax=Paramecium sonneborni TaxID=65129 RepID=A0A8S1M1X4_9CILI|nr:unnamed protein product [Paramecium sonneborni]
MGGQISQDDAGYLVDIPELIKKEQTNQKINPIADEFTLNKPKGQERNSKLNSPGKIASQIILNNEKQNIILGLKQVQSQNISDQPPVITTVSSHLLSQDSENSKQIKQNQNLELIQSQINPNNATLLNDSKLNIQKPYPEWAQQMINKYGKYECPQKPNYQENQIYLIKYNEGTYYQGQIQGSNNKHGYGILVQDSEIYEGYFKNNIKSGYGRLIKQDYLKQGIWENDIIVSDLEIRDQNMYYKGACQNELPHGKGIFENKDYKYEGYFQRGLKSGRGQLNFKNKLDYYDGQFLNDKMHGRGKYYFSNKVIYEGSFQDGQITGKGELKYPNGRFYRGDFLNGKMHGQGSLQNNQGGIYEGEFKDGLKHGFGKTVQNGVEVTGTWINGILNEEDQDQ